MCEVGFIQNWGIIFAIWPFYCRRWWIIGARAIQRNYSNQERIKENMNQPVSNWKDIGRRARHFMTLWSANDLKSREVSIASDEVQHLPASISVHCGRTCALAQILAQLSLPTSWQLPQWRHSPREKKHLLELGELSAVRPDFTAAFSVKLKQAGNDHVDGPRKETMSSSERICNWVLPTKSIYWATQQCCHTAHYTLKCLIFLLLEGIPPYVGQVARPEHGTG